MSVVDCDRNRFRFGATAWLGCALFLFGSSACSSDDPPGGALGNAGASVVSGGAPAQAGTGGTTATGGARATGGSMATGGMAAAGSGGRAVMMITGGTSGMPEGGKGAPMPSSADWPMMGYDLGSTYFNSAETVLTKENAATLEVKWTKDMGGDVYGAPLQIGDKIYASGPADVRAFDAAGTELWKNPSTSTSSMSYADGTLYLNNDAAEIVAINAADGVQLWAKAPTGDEKADGSSSAIVAGDMVLIGGSNGTLELSGGTFRGYLAALDRMTGGPKWVTYTVDASAKGASIWSTPSVDLAGGFIYAGTGNNYGSPATDSSDAIVQFDMAGAIKWKGQRTQGDTFGGIGGGPDYDFGANPVLYETMVGGTMTKLVSAGAKSGSAHALRRDTGDMVWTRSLGGGSSDGSSGVFVNSTWTGKYMLFACNGVAATLYALDGATGDIAWMRQLSGPVWGRMSVANGVGFAGVGSTLEAFDVDTGDMIKSFPSKGGTVAGTITIANGRVAFGEGLTWSSGQAGSTLTVLALP